MDRNEGNKGRDGESTGNDYEDEKRDIARQGGQPTSYGEGNQGKMGQDDQSGGDGDQSGNRDQGQGNLGGSHGDQGGGQGRSGSESNRGGQGGSNR